MKLPALALAAAGFAAMATTPTMASEPAKQGMSLSYADLDLDTAAGRATLSQRFDQAARDKCGLVEGQKAGATARYCYKTTGEQYRHFAESVVAQHDRAARDKRYGLAER